MRSVARGAEPARVARLRLAATAPAAQWAFDLRTVLLAVDARAVRCSMLIGALLVWLVGVPLAAALNVWIDEAFTLHTTAAGPLVAWSQAIRFEGQPPLYFVLESLWRAMDENSLAFALPAC